MLLEMDAPPKNAESRLLRLILPDFFLIFLVISAVGNAAVIYSGIVKFPQVLLLVPAICVLAAIVAFLRFYAYLSNVIRAMGALSFAYDELGAGKAEVRVDAKKPILLFGFLAAKGMQETKPQGFSFFMKSDSAKYKSETSITIDKTGYRLDIKLRDWRGHDHARSAKGRVPQLQGATIQVISDLRTEVLESTGVKVGEIAPPPEAYKPLPAKAPAVVPKKMPLPPKPPAPPVAELPPVLEKKAVEEKEEEIKAELEKPKSETEKKALQDILFQLEEIDKVIKEK